MAAKYKCLLCREFQEKPYIVLRERGHKLSKSFGVICYVCWHKVLKLRDENPEFFRRAKW